jgi:hypothetical protein
MKGNQVSEEKKTETREEMIARLCREEAEGEMMFELRAAFGGETDEVVNILTGKRIKLR